MINTLVESIVEQATVAWRKALGYELLNTPDVTARCPLAERIHRNFLGVPPPRIVSRDARARDLERRSCEAT